MKQAGFEDQEFVGTTGFNSSSVSTGALFRANKMVQAVDKPIEDAFQRYKAFLDAAYAEGSLDQKTKYLIALGASLGAECETSIRHCRDAARELGATEEELKETMAIALTVGATKEKILQESDMASLPEKKSPERPAKGKEEPIAETEAGPT